jgi:regulator of sirC expression with transglutaminase-like and TPR domain
VADPALLRRATKKDIAIRMLQNLRGVYLQRRDWARAVTTLDWLLIGVPDAAAWYKQRGLLEMELKRLREAQRDLEKYLALEPAAADRAAIVKQVQAIHGYLGRVN